MADDEENQLNFEINDPPPVESWHINPKVGQYSTTYTGRLELNSALIEGPSRLYWQ